MPRLRTGLASALLCFASAGCDRVLSDDVNDDVADVSEPAAAADTPEDRTVAAASGRTELRTTGLGTTVSAMMSGVEAIASTQAPVESLAALEGVEVSHVAASWRLAPAPYLRGPQVPKFVVDAALTAVAELPFSDIQYWAKATCEVEPGQRQASAAALSFAASRRGRGVGTLELGEPADVSVELFAQGELVGRYPCEISFRAQARGAKIPLAVGGAWCSDGHETTPGPCRFAERSQPAGAEPFGARDWKVSRDRRSLTVSIDFHNRVRLDRELVLRSTCDDGDALVARSETSRLPWGMFGPGDSVTVTFARYQGWFVDDAPCELSAQWWRRHDDGGRADPVTIGVACVPEFLAQSGSCGFERPEEGPAGTPALEVAKFEPRVTVERGGVTRLWLDVDFAAKRSVLGDAQLRVSGTCGGGRRVRSIRFLPESGERYDIIRAGDAIRETYSGWLHGGVKAGCTVRAQLVSARDLPAVDVAEVCIGRSGVKPC